jgi:sulfotransferase
MPAAPHVAKPTRKFHFISGMPRSGSTLLAAILNQNPRFRAGMTSPLADIMGVVMAEASSKNDFSFDVSDDQRVAMLRGLVENFYAGQADAGDRAASDRAVSEGTPSGGEGDRAASEGIPSGGIPSGDVVFDTSRLWCSRMQLLQTLFPDAKVIACVRQLSWVLDSMERLVRLQPVGVSKVFRFDTNTTVYSRVEALTDPRGMVGFSFQATKDAFYGQYAPGHLLLLTYESLARNPSAAMRAVYQFIGEPWFEHDFDHISYNAHEFDARVGLPGLHTVRPKVEPIERTPILPREIFGRFVNESFWMDPKNNISQVPVV